MAKRAADVAWAPMSDGECGLHPYQRNTRPRSSCRLSLPLYKATITQLAEKDSFRVGPSVDIDDAIVQRITKCLQRANHPTTPEAEAKVALHLASRLMGQHNVSQAEILAHEVPAARMQYAGQSVVTVQRLDENPLKPVRQQSYVESLCDAMTSFFDCKSYSTATGSCVEWTFYGIAENTIVAAMSFEMTYKLVAEWARPYRGVGAKNSYCLGISEELYRMSQAEKFEQEIQAKEAESAAIVAKVKHEKEERQKQLNLLAPQPVISNKPLFPEMKNYAQKRFGMDGRYSLWQHEDFLFNELSLSPDELEALTSSEGGSEDSSMDDFEPDFKLVNEDALNHFEDLDEEICNFIKSESPPFENLFGDYGLSGLSPRPRTAVSPSLPERKPTPTHLTDTKPTYPEPEAATKWSSHMQPVTFRATADKIAEDYLKCKGVKLYSRSARNRKIQDLNACKQGVQDSKKIDYT